MPNPIESFVRQAMDDFEGPLIAYAARMLGDTHRARDVVQDTFIRLCQQDPEKLRKGLKSWLFTVCRNRALDHIRKDKRLQPLDDIAWEKMAGSELRPDLHAEREEVLSNVMRVLARLSDNQREVILLKFQQGLSYREIATRTGLSSGNIGFLIHTGLKRVRELLPDPTHSSP